MLQPLLIVVSLLSLGSNSSRSWLISASQVGQGRWEFPSETTRKGCRVPRPPYFRDLTSATRIFSLILNVVIVFFLIQERNYLYLLTVLS